MICISKHQCHSPISGADFYKKNEYLDDTYYVNKSDANLHHIMLCVGMKTTVPKIFSAISQGKEVANQDFFESSEYYVKDNNEVCELIMNAQSESDLNIFDEINELFEKIDNLEKKFIYTDKNNASTVIFKTNLIRLKPEYEIYNLILGKPNSVKEYNREILNDILKLLDSKYF